VPDERPGRVDLAVSAHGVAAVDVDDVVVSRLQEEGLGLEADRVEGGEEGEDLVDPALGPDRGWWPGMIHSISSARTEAMPSRSLAAYAVKNLSMVASLGSRTPSISR
jgi:hypothetical protein